MVVHINTKEDGAATNAIALSTGHRILPEKMRACYKTMHLSRGNLCFICKRTFSIPNERKEKNDGKLEDEGFGGKENNGYLPAIARHQRDQ